MALAIADRVKETTTSTGTGTINLAGAATGFQTFVAGIGDGNTCYYAIEDANGSAWEVGIGTVTDASPDTLARTTVLKSTNSNNAITLTSGTHTVFATYPADKAIFKNASGFVGIGTDSPSFSLDVYGHNSWMQASGVRVGPSGTVMLDADLSHSITLKAPDVVSTSFTFLLPSGDGSNGQVLTTDSKNTYWSSAGDITAVVAGSGMSGGATSGSATVTLDLNGLASGVVADNDYLVFVDVDDSNSGKKENLGDIAALFAGTNLTATNSVIAVDDAFLVNDDNDTTTGTITSAGFTTTGNVNAKDGNFKEFDSWVYSSGIRIGASGIILDGTAVTASVTELNYVDGVTSAVQTQLDAKQASLTFGISNTNAVKVDSASAADDEYARFTANGLESRSTSEVLSDIGAQASIGGAASTVTSSDLTASRALVSNGSGKIAVSSTTSTELGYIDVSTLGTAEASKALTLDSDKKFTGVKDGTFNQADSWITASGVTVGASGVVMKDADLSHSITVKAPEVVSTSFTFLLPSGDGSNGQVLTTDSKNTYWSTASGGVSGDTFATDLKIGRDSDNLIDFATTDNKIILRANGNDEVELVENALSPVANDGVALGTGSLMWSDLFIADGGVVNFNNGDATLTHESNKIVASGCELFVNRPGRSLATFRRTDNGDASIEVDASFHDADNDAQLRMLSGTSGDCSIFFGDTADNNIGLITYAHQTDAFTIKTNATAAIVIDSDGTLQTKGIIREVATKVDTNYTITASDHVILVDTTNGDRDITLPSAAAANIGQEYTIKKIDSGTGVVNIIPASTGGYGPDDIDEYDTKYVLYVQHDTVTFVCGPGDDSATDEQWWIIAEKVTPHCARLFQDTAQEISNSTSTVVSMDSTLFALGCTPDLTNNKIVITRPGKYLCGGFCRMSGISGSQYIFLTINRYDLSTTTNTEHGGTNKHGVSNRPSTTTQVLLDLESGDEITLRMWQNGGDNDTVSAGNNTKAYLWIKEVR